MLSIVQGTTLNTYVRRNIWRRIKIVDDPILSNLTQDAMTMLGFDISKDIAVASEVKFAIREELNYRRSYATGKMRFQMRGKYGSIFIYIDFILVSN